LFALPSVPMQLHWLGSPLLLESIRAAVDSRATEVKLLAAALDRSAQHFPIKFHVKAGGLSVFATGGPRNFSALISDHNKTRGGGLKFSVDQYQRAELGEPTEYCVKKLIRAYGRAEIAHVVAEHLIKVLKQLPATDSYGSLLTV